MLSFKKCVLGDLEVLVHISRSTFIEAFEKDNDPEDFETYIEFAFEKDKLEKELKDENASFYFIYEGINLVGYFKMNINEAQTDLKTMDAVELERIYVVNGHQGKGIGEKMLQKAKDLSMKTGKTYLWLGVWEHNKSAIKFYEKHGFSKFGMHPYYIGKDRQTDWLMQFDLTNFQ